MIWTPSRRSIQKIQAFDPPGVAARDLRECLLLQAQQIYPGEQLLQKIIRDHLDHLAKRNYQAVAKELGVSLEEVVRSTRLISELDPRPGRGFSDENIPYITPDVYVFKVGDEYVVMLNEDGLAQTAHQPLLPGYPPGAGPAAGEAKEYINDKIRSALWLIKSIHQRQRTIYRVTKSIVRFQREFLDKGVAFLKPMVLKDVAMDVEMHESTISRVTSNKYVHTPQGIFELKYFFNSSINTSRGENIASESVKEKIRLILAKEDPQKPYSDQELVEILKKQDILIARRTVTKYREMLGVLPSTQRKQIIYKPREWRRRDMQVSVTFRNMESKDVLRDIVQEKISKLKKYLDYPLEANVVLTMEKHRQIAEVNLVANRLPSTPRKRPKTCFPPSTG